MTMSEINKSPVVGLPGATDLPPPEQNPQSKDAPTDENVGTLSKNPFEQRLLLLRHTQKPRSETAVSFQHQEHSLRISVSDIAACAGFHPYKSLVKLVMDHVYQGSSGQALLRHDSQLLGIALVSEEEALRQIAQQAGASTKQALEMALKVQTGEKKVDTVQQASRLKQKVVEEAKKSNKLSAVQLQQLQEGARQTVNTGFGTSWESQALDLYERRCGWEVSDRNAEVRTWPFTKVVDDHGVPSAHAVQPAYAFHWQRDHSASERELKRQKTVADNEVVDLVDSDDGSTSREDEVGHLNASSNRQKHSPSPRESPSFFNMRGAIDGMREELTPTTNTDDDDSWVLKKIVVECKHRMNKLQPSPPLYEMIQTTAYCFMYQVQDADLVQVLREQRNPTKRDHDQKKQHATSTTNENQNCTNIDTTNSKMTQTTHCLTREGVKQDEVTSTADIQPWKTVDGDTCTSSTPTTKEEQIINSLEEKPSKIEIDDPSGKEGSEKDSSIRSSTQSSSLTAPEATRDEQGESETLSNACPNSSLVDQQNLDSDKSQEPNVGRHTSENFNVGTAAASNDTVSNQKEKENVSSCHLKISVHRISLEDPLLQHRYHWKAVILPRLRSWVDSVYSIRRSDDKRYRLLTALASDCLADAWQILFEECPWLRDCDTSYLRDIQGS